MTRETLQMCEWFLQAQLLVVSLSILLCCVAANTGDPKAPTVKRKDGQA